MSDKDDGGPAFPVQWQEGGETVAVPGMTLRDWFAGQALAGVLASEVAPNNFEQNTRAARWAYKIADAMLEARK